MARKLIGVLALGLALLLAGRGDTRASESRELG